MTYQILLYYKYISIDHPEELVASQRELCERLSLKGRIIVAKEGINGTVEGFFEDTEAYIQEMCADLRFADIHFKRSEGTGNAFPKLSVKLRSEIVSGHLADWDVNPNEITGKYLAAEELHEWISSNKEFYIVDMRNDYEHRVGYFENSILPKLTNFRDLPQILPEIEHLKNKTVLTVCTGGVRCEKASGFLLKHGFSDVYQLFGGIVSYMEKYPNEDFLGKLYVFDGRIVMGFNTDDAKHVVVGKCFKCGQPSDDYVDCAYLHCSGERHFLCCQNCRSDDGNAYCDDKCYELSRVAITV